MSIEICKELHQNFIDFAYEANSQRAFPDARDGLKPGQRACLWEFYTKGYTSNKPHVKSAKVAGGVIANWWPHGDAAIYETFVRMSQPWINNIPEVSWHGNNGSQIIDGKAAASRYTEARLSKAIEEGMFQGIKKKNVPMIQNFSEDDEWAEVLPAIFPRLMVNGSQGIGVTVANNWLLHNLGELCEIIDKYVKTGNLDYSNLAPDFPTGGIIINKNELSSIYSTGKGKAIVRGKAEIKGNSILITEFPYQVYVESFIDEVKELIEKENLAIDDIFNKSDKKKLLVEIVCSGSPSFILQKLYSSTSLQKSFNANQMALVSKTPVMLNLQKYLDIYIRHNLDCLVREFTFDIKKAKDRLEIVEGLIKALVNIDEIIQLIKNSENSTKAKEKLIEVYALTENQAKAIIDMKLGRLAKLEAIELNKEKEDLINRIEELNNILKQENKQKEIFLIRLNTFSKKYSTPRKTSVTQINIEAKEKEIITVEPKECVVIVSDSGLIKRIPSKSFKTQGRNGVGIKNGDDIIKYTCRTNTIDTLMVFSSKGKVYKILVDNIPEGTNASKGTSIYNLITFDNGEQPMAYASLYRDSQANFVFFATKNGVIKKVPLSEYGNTKKKTGIIAINLKEEDSLAAVTFIQEEQMMLITKNGMAIRFETKDMPISSRIAQGVKGIKLNEGDYVLNCVPISHADYTLGLFSENGYGKRCNLKEFPVQARAGKGVSCSKEFLAGCCLLDEKDQILVSGNKTSIRIEAKSLPVQGRTTQGVIILKNNNKVVSISKI